MDISIIRFTQYAEPYITYEQIAICYVVEGELLFTYRGKTNILQKGNAVVITPNTPFTANADNTGDTAVFILLIKTSALTSAFLNLLTEDNSLSRVLVNILFSREPSPFIIIRSQPDDDLKAILLRLFELQGSHNPCPAMENALAQLFLSHIFYYYEENIQKSDALCKKDTLVAKIISYMHCNLSTTSLKDVSNAFSFSAKYLSKLLKEKTGMSYIALVTHIKLENTTCLLKNTSLSVEEISSIIGYDNPRELRSLFSQKYGVSPREYRKNIKLW